jgi:hypothetical protein
VRVAHLFLGTHQDNMTDMMHKGRCQGKLSLEQVLYVRKELANGRTGVSLAQELGVSGAAISYAKKHSRLAGLSSSNVDRRAPEDREQ